LNDAENQEHSTRKLQAFRLSLKRLVITNLPPTNTFTASHAKRREIALCLHGKYLYRFEKMIPFCDQIATLVGVLYPAVETYKALDTVEKDDDIQVR